MRNILGLVVLGSVIASPAWANPSFNVTYPPNNYKTASEKIFFIGTAPPAGQVLVNGQAIARSPAGHFAPSFPLKLGDNQFTLRYNNQDINIKVTRTSSQPKPPAGLAFAEDSLEPAVDVARLPNELVCLGAIAPPNATVSAQLGGQTIPLMLQPQVVNLPANSAALTQQNQPQAIAGAGKFLGCAAAAVAADFGKPQFQLTRDGQTVSQQGPGKVQILSPAQLEIAEVIVDAGVARTGPSTDYSRLTPLPKGTRASVTGREGEWVRLDYGGWINSKEVGIVKNSAPPRSLIRSVSSRKVPGATEVRFPLQVPVPMTVQQGDRKLLLTLYNTTAQTDIIRMDDDPVISRLDWQQIAPGVVQYTFNLKSQQQWGYQLKYEGTSLVLSLRHPPTLTKQSAKPLSGIKIVLDPGHGGQDSGTQGPTGYPEKDVNLIMSKLVGNQLIARGATVYMTRETDKAVSLPERVAFIDKVQPAIALSIHYNSLPDEGDAQNTQGFGAFWYHPQAHSLALFMHNYIVKLGRPSYGVFWDNLALARPATAPSVLLELGFMSNPVEFEWVVNPQAQQNMAAAIADGITQWFAVTQ
ncbi:MAG: N-acetylmuramoyl-L-alanine amidase [Aphanothece sp. CMT-3BRIN-NPC111]|nr:N-acetylmuramoyl-L-alanine amidase [Aphanothece sp. CMT-3BRIN-NPC111]